MRQLVLRIGYATISIFVVSLIIFSAIALLPGDFATETLGQNAAPETLAALRRSVHLDVPFWRRYVLWLIDVVHGDLGTSWGTSRAVTDLVGPRFGNTLALAAVTALIGVPLAVTAGALCAVWPNSWQDRTLNAFALFSTSLPEFLIGYCLIYVFSVRMGWFPNVANQGVLPSLPNWAHQVVLPVLTLLLANMAHVMRITRTLVLNLLSSQYVEMAILKGLRPVQIIVWHVLPNAWGPLATVIAISLANLVVGVVVVEYVFVYPGLGQVFVDAISRRDIPVVQACSLLFAGSYIVLNAIADLFALVSNPRLRHQQ